MVMAEDSALLRDDLLTRIESRRSDVRAYLRENRPRLRRRANLTIVLSALAALFTAGPAVGGETFSHSVQQNLGLGSDSLVWRLLCLAALVVSLSAAVLTNVGKSEDAAGRLSAAEAVNAELEGLTTLLQFGQLPVEEAVKLYQQYAVKIPFVEDVAAPTAGSPGRR
jgi:hypothetical protein